jgi:hypothetical protein
MAGSTIKSIDSAGRIVTMVDVAGCIVVVIDGADCIGMVVAARSALADVSEPAVSRSAARLSSLRTWLFMYRERGRSPGIPRDLWGS